jgi:hypothetical protein
VRSNFTIRCEPMDLQEGLFGQVFLQVFEILPVLHALKLYPAWDIKSSLYGPPPSQTVIPGILELAYAAPQGQLAVVPFRKLHRWSCHALGNDWAELARLWRAYFTIPARVEAQADRLGPMQRTLGVHYRGNDKVSADWDTNFLSQDDFVALILDFLGRRPDIARLFVATDDFTFVAKLQSAIALPIVNLGAVGFHKAADEAVTWEKSERALLDCVLLSRCAAVLQTSSALSSFAKVLNPALEIYRCAASKIFSDVPYFPVAYVPPLAPSGGAAIAIMARTMRDDWTSTRRAARFEARFVSRRRSFLRGRFGKSLKRILRVDLDEQR